VQIAALVLGQPEHPRQAVQDLRGRVDVTSLLQVGVPGGAEPGQHRDLLAAQPGDPAPAAGGQPDLLRGQLRAPGGEEIPDLVAVVGSLLHAFHGNRRVRASGGGRGVELVPL
jgi:hypothetical protein